MLLFNNTMSAFKTVVFSLQRAERAVIKVPTFRDFLFSTRQLHQTFKVFNVHFLPVLHLKQCSMLTFHTDLPNKRRKKTFHNQPPNIFMFRFISVDRI